MNNRVSCQRYNFNPQLNSLKPDIFTLVSAKRELMYNHLKFKLYALVDWDMNTLFIDILEINNLYLSDLILQHWCKEESDGDIKVLNQREVNYKLNFWGKSLWIVKGLYLVQT